MVRPVATSTTAAMPAIEKNESSDADGMGSNVSIAGQIKCDDALQRRSSDGDVMPKAEDRIKSHGSKLKFPAEESSDHHRLFHLIRNRFYEEAIAYVKKYPHSSNAKISPQNQTPLHFLCSSPVSLSTPCPKISNAHHNSQHAYFELLESLVLSMGDVNSMLGHAIFTPDQRGRTPLNIALDILPQHDIVEALLRPYKSQRLLCPPYTKKERKTSLHVAISNGCSVETVRSIAWTFPKFITIGDHRTGNTPLHLAVLRLAKNDASVVGHTCEKDIDTQNLSPILLDQRDGKSEHNKDAEVGGLRISGREYSTSEATKDVAIEDSTAKHSTPLSPLELKNQSPKDTATSPDKIHTDVHDIIWALLEAHPSASSTKNKQSQLPLHVLCYVSHRSWAYASLLLKLKAAIRLLVKAYPEGLVQKDCRGFTPIDYVLLHDKVGDDSDIGKQDGIATEVLQCMYDAASEMDTFYEQKDNES